jgi:uncharacterized protein YdhG (YjbR/CyaY superfamily)
VPDQLTTVDVYVAGLGAEQRAALHELRALVRALLPEAGARISHRMPTATLDGRAVLHHAAWQKHLSLHPVPRGDVDLEAVATPYRAATDARASRRPTTQPARP